MITIQEQLQDQFIYDETEPFALRWRKRRFKTRIIPGDVAGYWHRNRAGDGALQRYVEVRVDGKRKRIPTHFAVWIYHHGALPLRYQSIVFRNGDNGDCRLTNLIERSERRTGLDQRLRSYFGITESDYNAMLTAQNGVCAICQNPETVMHSARTRNGLPGGDRELLLSVDHCHDGGHVRGLLCQSCNNGLGRFKDNLEVLRRAVTYLEADKTIARTPLPPKQAQRKKFPVTPGKLMGAFFRNGRWRAKIMVDYKTHFLGNFDTAEEAHAAYLDAVKRLRIPHGNAPSIAG